MRAVILVSLSLCACLPLPPEHTYDDERQITVDWSLKGPADTAGRCPSGSYTVVVEACTTEDLYGCFTAEAPCEPSGSQTLTVYTSGRYRPDENSSFWDLTTQYWIYISLTDPTGERYATSTPVTKDLAGGDATVEASLYPEAGFLSLSWDLTSAASGNLATRCSQYDVDEIELKFAEHTSSEPPLTESVTWPCDARDGLDVDDDSPGGGLTQALEPASYVGDAIAYRAGVEVGRAEDVTFTIEDRGDITRSYVYIEITDR